MPDYLLLYSGGHMPESPEEQGAVMQAWEAWSGKLGSALKDGGNPFTGQAKTIGLGGEVAEGGLDDPISGYSIVTAASLDEAVGMAKGSPVLQGGAEVHVIETVDVMAMMQTR